MKFNAHSSWMLFSAVMISLLVGCGKKEESTPTPAPEVAAPAVQQVKPSSAPTAQNPAASDARLVESQIALSAREYDKAAEALIAMQRTRLSEQQAAAAAAQMRQLQANLAQAVANGDPRAKAAADRLRQSAMPQ